ncbi:MAG: cytochrome-c peroxidase, partial [Pseudomonadota bacterium]
ALSAYQQDAVLPRFDAEDVWAVMDDPGERRELADAARAGAPLSEDDLDALLAFLDTLTDPVALQGRLGIPDRVPSGLPIDH